MPRTFPLFRAAQPPQRAVLYHWLRDLRLTVEIGEVESVLTRWMNVRARADEADAPALAAIDGRICAIHHRLRILRACP